MKNNKTKHEFIKLRAEGNSFDNIAKTLKVAKSTLIEWSNEFEYEVANLKAIELESLQQQFFIAKKTRIEVIGEETRRIKEELGKRELKDIPTEKLFDIFLKYMQSLKEEEVETKFTIEKEEELEDLINETLTTTKTWKAD